MGETLYFLYSFSVADLERVRVVSTPPLWLNRIFDIFSFPSCFERERFKLGRNPSFENIQDPPLIPIFSAANRFVCAM